MERARIRGEQNMKKLIILLLSIVCLLVITACSSKSESNTNNNKSNVDGNDQPEEVRIGYQVIPNAELLAKQLGLVEAKFPDTKIKWIEFDSGRDVNTAMASGNLDFGLAGSVPTVTGISNNLAYQVYFIHDVIGAAESLAVKKTAGIKEISDLKGKKVAVPFGSTAHFSLLMALDDAGVKANDVVILDMQPQDIAVAWERGDIDGAFVWHPTLAGILESGGEILVTAEQLAEKGIITADLGLISNKFAEKYPKFVTEYIAVLDNAISDYREDPQKAAKTLSETLSLTEEQVLSQMEGLIWLNYSEQLQSQYLGIAEQAGQFIDVLESTGKFLKEQEVLTSSPSKELYKSAIFYAK